MVTVNNHHRIPPLLLLLLLLGVVSSFTFVPSTKTHHRHHHPTTTAILSSTSATSTTSSPKTPPQPYNNNVLILDHLNINHEKSRHDYLKSFYFDFLKCIPDPRKAENLKSGKKTLWANIGAHQVHLPEGNPAPQVLEGVITLVYPDLSGLIERSESGEIVKVLSDSKFNVGDVVEKEGVTSMQVTDPWGTQFRLIQSPKAEKDERGLQKGGDLSEGIAMKDLTFYVSPGTNIEGTGRFYEQILNAPVLEVNEEKVVVSMGPNQTLTFCIHPENKEHISHVDMVDQPETKTEGKPHYLSNFGPHISMYISDIRSTYQRIQDLGLTYVNPRFKRRAYDMEEVVDDCMFRIIDIVDPDDEEGKVILQLEHEVRSVMKRDGSLYKSCPFVDIPDGCVI